MTEEQYAKFKEISLGFKAYVDAVQNESPWLKPLQERLRVELGYDDYRVETPIVFNLDLDRVKPEDDPLFILVADNPGKAEQKAENRRYLIGQSGKLAAGWFRKEMGMDFRSSCLIINKTPLHTPKTAELRKLLSIAGDRREDVSALLRESQLAMARFAYALHSLFGNILWVSGYGELGPRGLFRDWKEEILRLYAPAPQSMWDKLWVFRHFSMNQFSIEYSRYSGPSAPAIDRLRSIGSANRSRILGSPRRGEE